MIIALIILSLSTALLLVISILLTYGVINLGGQRDELTRQSALDRETRELSVRLILEKFKYRLPLTERSLTEEIFSSRKERGEL
jgi:type II secretory pathway pseudopilin PulG